MPKNVTRDHFDVTIARLESRMEGFVTKDEFRTTIGEFRNDMMTKMDGLATILRRLDEDRVFAVEWIKRVESDVNRIKGHLKLA